MVTPDMSVNRDADQAPQGIYVWSLAPLGIEAVAEGAVGHDG
jgi:hypothetical protein